MSDIDENAQSDASAQSLQTEQTPKEFEEQAPTPFDHPFFLPVLMSGLTLWFGYDGWLNTDPDMLEHLMFNRVGAGVLLLGAIYTGVGGYREWREMKEQEPPPPQ